MERTQFIVVVEDDVLIGSSLCRALAHSGYRAIHACTLAEAREAVGINPPDLVLLDIILPDGDGVEYCAELSAQHPQLPVVMLTARTDETDVVMALRNGAVDHVAKPFRLAELFARIERHLQLAARPAEVTETGPPEIVTVGALRVEADARRAQLGGRELCLRPREFDLLLRLARDAGRAVTRERLIEDVWDANWWGPTKTLDFHINSLRRKIGYRLDSDQDQA